MIAWLVSLFVAEPVPCSSAAPPKLEPAYCWACWDPLYICNCYEQFQ